MADIFDRAGQQYGGSFAADAARVVFSVGGGAFLGSTGVGLLTQQLNVNYTQQITRVYEVGTNFTFLVGGRTQGSIGMGRVLGPRPVMPGFYSKYGNVCNAANNVLSLELEAGCPEGAAAGNDGGLSSLSFIVKNLVITTIGVTVASQDMVINEQIQAMFISLEAGSA